MDPSPTLHYSSPRAWFGNLVATALVTSTKSSYTSSPVSIGMGDHLWRVYHAGIFQATHANSAWPSLRGYAQRVLAMVSATAGDETASSASGQRE